MNSVQPDLFKKIVPFNRILFGFTTFDLFNAVFQSFFFKIIADSVLIRKINKYGLSEGFSSADVLSPAWDDQSSCI